MIEQEFNSENDIDRINLRSNDEIAIKELFTILWRGKLTIFLFIIVFAILSVVYALSLKNIYKSEVLIAPVGQQQGGGSISGQLGGLAALAGVNIGGSNSVDKTTLALETLKSRSFVSKFIERRDLAINLMAANDWDSVTNKLVIDPEVYNIETNLWVREVSFPKKQIPSSQEVFGVFSDLFNVTKDIKSGMVTLSFKHYSPYFAKEILDWIVVDINEEMKIKDIQESERSISYLEAQLSKTNISEVKSTLSSLIEEQTKTLMLANTRTEYMFKVVDHAVVPENRFEPKRSLIVALAIVLGGIFGVLAVLLFPSLREKNKSLN